MSISDLNHTNSSIPSQIIETTRTKIKGKIDVAGFVGAICGILAQIAAARKYTFASHLNYTSKAIGKNVKTLYLVVQM